MMDFPRASIEPRGCGERDTGVYAECGLSPYGSPLKVFLLDPVEPLPEGLDASTLANKAQVWVDQRTGIAHLISWVGEKGYPHVWDMVREIARLGASRHISSNTPNLELLVPGVSKLVLVHPRALDPLWQGDLPLDTCEKERPRHDLTQLAREQVDIEREPEKRMGPCLYQLQSLIPTSAGEYLGEEGGRRISGRTVGSTYYTYSPHPASRTDRDCQAARFAVLPLTSFCFVKGKKKDPDLEASLERARRRLQEAEFPMYDLDMLGE
jgi:hypothetical protein